VRGRPLALLGEAKYRASNFHEAVNDLKAAIPLLEEGGDVMQASLYGGTLAVAYAHLGRFEEALRALERSSELARQSGDPTAIIDADLARSEIEALLGNPDAAILYAELSAYCDLVPVRIELSRALLDSARAAAGLAEPSVDGFERAAELARAIGDRLSEGKVLRQRARHRLRTGGEIEPALTDFSEAERLFEALEARPNLARTLREHAAALTAVERGSEARPLAVRAKALIEQMGIGVGQAS
jgi:tetratricopeptide (TPR) repeat protein